MEQYEITQQEAKAKILSSYNLPKTVIEKSEENDLEKGGKGEGSRGGKVIGHTKSGKPIYDVDSSKTNDVSGKEGYHSDFQDNHKHYTSEDHKDAHEAHLKQHAKHGEAYHKHYNSATTDEWNEDNNEKGKAARKGTREAADEQNKHGKLADWHKEAASKKEDEEKYGQSIGKTSSGKHIHKNKDAANYKDFSTKDHKEAADIHKKHEKDDENHGIEKRYQHLHRSGKTDEEKDSLFDSYTKEHKAKKNSKKSLTKADFENDIEKGGEGSKGGKVIGHTKSGKAIYEKHDHEGHKDFSKHDHKDAADLHDMKSREHWDKADEEEGNEDVSEAHVKTAKHHDTQWQHHNHKSLSDKQVAARKNFSKGEENDLIKGGEGSKGGKVIGHTKSGKAIYEKHEHSSHKEFTHEDHAEAAIHHHKLSDDAKDMKGLIKHSKASVHHWEKHYEKGGKYKTEDSNKLRAEIDKKGKVEKSESVVEIGTISPNGKFIKGESGWEKNIKEDINKGMKGVEIGTISPDGKFQKSESGWNKLEK